MSYIFKSSLLKSLFIISLFAVLTACGGGSSSTSFATNDTGSGIGSGGGTGSGSGSGSGSNCGNTSLSSYTISWNPVSDSDLSNYKVYYGTNSPLTKYNAAGSFDSASNSAQFSPSNYNFSVCTKVYLAVASVGTTKAESALSAINSITVAD